MKVGVPKEIKNNEFRVGLTPGSVREYVAHGHDVYIETNAGGGINASDEDYKAAGAQILQTAEEVFAIAEMIVKVKEPQPSEWAQLRQDQILYTYLHLAPDAPQTMGLIESGCTA
ncbi:MAG: alanine dehydrogenase, partial [Nitratireductor sp.]